MSLRRNAFLLIASTVLVAILGLWSDHELLARAWRLPLGVLLLGLAYELWIKSRAGLSATIGLETQGILGRTGTLHLTLTHRSQRDITVELAPDAPAAVQAETFVRSLAVPAASVAHIEQRITPRRLGEHHWPPLRARIAGPLGLAWWPEELTTGFRLRVVPEVLRPAQSRAGGVHTGIKPRQFAGSGTEVLQLRDYRTGDPQQLIDWKASARTGRLMSRETTEDQHLEIVVAIDAGRTSALRAGSLDRFGHYANVTARFAEHAIALDDRVGLVLFADLPLAALAPGRGAAAVQRIRRLLAAAQPAQTESNPLNAALRIRALTRQRSLIVLLTDLDDATTAGQLSSAARLLMPKHLPLIAGLSSPELEQLRHAPARTWLDPYEALAAQEHCLQLERNVLALQALGTPAVLARPDQLESAIFAAYAGFRQRRRV
jgi:uncharacterized protein (DUF58 family)